MVNDQRHPATDATGRAASRRTAPPNTDSPTPTDAAGRPVKLNDRAATSPASAKSTGLTVHGFPPSPVPRYTPSAGGRNETPRVRPERCSLHVASASPAKITRAARPARSVSRSPRMSGAPTTVITGCR